LLAVCLLLVLSPAAWAQAEVPVADDEKLLKGAGLPVDGPGLAEHFRRLVVSPEDEKRIEQLVVQLGDMSFKVRERAFQALQQEGPKALPALRRVSATGELEVQRRAAGLIEKIEQRHSSDTTAAAVRLLRARRPEVAVKVLLEYAPFATHANVEEEILAALYGLTEQAGQVDPALVRALTDRAPARRAAAALVVGRFGTAQQREDVRRLLADAEARVRLRAAFGLACAGDRTAVPVLVEALRAAPLELAYQAEDLLTRLAGDGAPPQVLGESAAARTASHAAWQKWWQAAGEKLDLSKSEVKRPFSGVGMSIRRVTHDFLMALGKGNVDDLMKTIDVPFAIGGYAVFKTPKELDDVLRPAVQSMEKKRFTFKILRILSVDEYLKFAPATEHEYLKQQNRRETRVVEVEGQEEKERPEIAYLILRVRGSRAWVTGIGLASKK
jgi:hypothetical protein